jgi:hypothetical protein
MTQATYDDVSLILRLYEMRREEKLRTARAWFSSNFKVKTLADFDALCPKGAETNAYARQVMTYWEMVASFITAGVLNQDLFFQSGRELLFVWTRVQPMLGELRSVYKDPNSYKNLEIVGSSYAEYEKKQSPEGYENFVTRVRG